jgi:hypothetical protein
MPKTDQYGHGPVVQTLWLCGRNSPLFCWQCWSGNFRPTESTHWTKRVWKPSEPQLTEHWLQRIRNWQLAYKAV